LLTGLGLGVGLMYLLDPDRGTGRRALIRDQVTHYQTKGTRVITGRSRHLRNKAMGMLAEVRRGSRQEAVSDDILVARVRSKMGLVVSRPRAIEVTAENGKIVLSGPILANEVERLLQTVSAIPGVEMVENWLEEIEESEREMPVQRTR
jgi:hypothetical protein